VRLNFSTRQYIRGRTKSKASAHQPHDGDTLHPPYMNTHCGLFKTASHYPIPATRPIAKEVKCPAKLQNRMLTTISAAQKPLPLTSNLLLKTVPSGVITLAFGNVAKAKGMTQVARDAGKRLRFWVVGLRE
jgi:hypothetical protein